MYNVANIAIIPGSSIMKIKMLASKFYDNIKITKLYALIVHLINLYIFHLGKTNSKYQ